MELMQRMSSCFDYLIGIFLFVVAGAGMVIRKLNEKNEPWRAK
jgi:hypothetical protein